MPLIGLRARGANSCGQHASAQAGRLRGRDLDWIEALPAR
jgi:hypothetical protein